MELIAIIIALIVPIGVAIWTVRSSAKDTAKKIAALEESTQKQIDSIKELSRQMIDSTIKQVELEIEKTLFLANQAKEEWEGIQNVPGPQNAWDVNYKERGMHEFQKKRPERDCKRYCDFKVILDSIKQGLIENKTKLC